MRVTILTKIFPNSIEPLSSPFNRQQFVALGKRADVRVLCAIPYVPLARMTHVPKRAAALAALPREETVAGLQTRYVRQAYVPRMGLAVAVPLLLGSLWRHRDWLAQSDVILGSWAYPDGAAAVLAAERIGRPAVVKVHGSDINVLAEHAVVRRMMSRILPRAARCVVVSNALGDRLRALGVPSDRIERVENGVDPDLFSVKDRAIARGELGVSEFEKLVVFCGRLEPAKGMVELLEAFDRLSAEVPGVRLALLGSGAMNDQVAEKARASGGRLLQLGARPLPEVARWLSACDVFTLPSHREGTPNVVLEALASGRPVVATRVGGIPDVVRSERAGFLVEPHDAHALADALARALRQTWDASDVATFGPRSWDESGARLFAVLEHAVRSVRSR